VHAMRALRRQAWAAAAHLLGRPGGVCGPAGKLPFRQ
jgi:hypothetical protein